ncbi:MAG: methyl-accepting chemotaxis protein [Treponema sp.]|nr:methyl-accepting chemotaxis protein [Treponema sp.]
MKDTDAGSGNPHRGSIKRKFIVFSIVFFAAIMLGGGMAFILSMRTIVHSSVSNDLSHTILLERTTLEASVNGEIAIALKMADSPLIKRYFQNPGDPALVAIAFEEIAGYQRAFAANTVFWVNDLDRRFHSDGAYVFTIDATDPDNYWYLMTLNETESYNFNINYNPDLDVTNLWINAPVFADNGRPIGILGTGIDLTAFTNSIYDSYTGAAALYFFNELGEITGARDSRLVADKVTLGDRLGATGERIFAMTGRIEPGTIETALVLNSEIALGMVPALGWYAVAVLPIGLGDYLQTDLTAFVLVIAVLILVIFIIFNISIATFLKPLNIIVSFLDQISADWDLTRRLNIQRNDEIGVLADFFNQTFERIRQLLKVIRDDTGSLSGTGAELASNMGKTAATVSEISSHVQNMKGQVLTQANEVNSASISLDRIIAGLDKLNEHISVQAESVAQSSSAIEEMLASIRAVTETLIKNKANISSLGESSEAGRSDLQIVSQDIQEIARESEGLLQINAVMESISSQTNLLSMNAAIEAAHAGEAGKGFAVVAAEIRKLAESSGQQSKTISEVLNRIKASIDTITKSTGVVLERFEAIAADVETVSNQEAQIRNAMEEQEAGSRQILEAVGQLNSITGLVKSASADIAMDSKDVVAQSSSLKMITHDVSGGMDWIAIGGEQINMAVNKVNEISVKNKNNIDTLSMEISKFKVE